MKLFFLTMYQYTDISSYITLYSSSNKSKKLTEFETQEGVIYNKTDTNHILRPKVGKRMHNATSQTRSFHFVLLASTTVMT